MTYIFGIYICGVLHRTWRCIAQSCSSGGVWRILCARWYLVCVVQVDGL